MSTQNPLGSQQTFITWRCTAKEREFLPWKTGTFTWRFHFFASLQFYKASIKELWKVSKKFSLSPSSFPSLPLPPSTLPTPLAPLHRLIYSYTVLNRPWRVMFLTSLNAPLPQISFSRNVQQLSLNFCTYVISEIFCFGQKVKLVEKMLKLQVCLPSLWR